MEGGNDEDEDSDGEDWEQQEPDDPAQQ